MKVEKVKYKKDEFLTDLLSILFNDSIPDKIEVAPLKAIVLVKYLENQAQDKTSKKFVHSCVSPTKPIFLYSQKYFNVLLIEFSIIFKLYFPIPLSRSIYHYYLYFYFFIPFILYPFTLNHFVPTHLSFSPNPSPFICLAQSVQIVQIVQTAQLF